MTSQSSQSGTELHEAGQRDRSEREENYRTIGSINHSFPSCASLRRSSGVVSMIRAGVRTLRKNFAI